jgi:hypothetical protein
MAVINDASQTYGRSVPDGLGHRRSVQALAMRARRWPHNKLNIGVYDMVKLCVAYEVRIFKKNRPGRSGPRLYTIYLT